MCVANYKLTIFLSAPPVQKLYSIHFETPPFYINSVVLIML